MKISSRILHNAPLRQLYFQENMTGVQMISWCLSLYVSAFIRYKRRFQDLASCQWHLCFVRRFPPAHAAQGWLHAFPLVDTLQQSRAPAREKAPQWLGHPGALNETGETEAAVISVAKRPDCREWESPEADRHSQSVSTSRTERPPHLPLCTQVTSHGAEQFRLNSGQRALCSDLRCWDVRYTHSLLLSSFPLFLSHTQTHTVIVSFMQGVLNEHPVLPDDFKFCYWVTDRVWHQQKYNSNSILTASQGGDSLDSKIGFTLCPQHVAGPSVWRSDTGIHIEIPGFET